MYIASGYRSDCTYTYRYVHTYTHVQCTCMFCLDCLCRSTCCIIHIFCEKNFFLFTQFSRHTFFKENPTSELLNSCKNFTCKLDPLYFTQCIYMHCTWTSTLVCTLYAHVHGTCVCSFNYIMTCTALMYKCNTVVETNVY